MNWVEQQSSSRSSIGPNWSRQPLGGVKKPSLNTRTPSEIHLLSWIRSLTALLRIPLSWIHFLSEKWTLSSAMCSGPHPVPWWEEKPPSLLTSFYSFTLVYFLSVSSCAKLRLPRTTSPRLCKTSQRPLQRLLNSKPISFGETLFCKGRQKGIL